MPDSDQLPSQVRDLAGRLGVNPRLSHALVKFTERGRLRQDAATPWVNYRARQTILIHECGFDWRARTGPAGLIRVQDALIGGVGRLNVRALGVIPVARAGGNPQVTRGELMRYLAELPWAPDAISRNPHLRWSVEAPDRLRVSAGEGETLASVTLNLDGAGRVASTFAPDRPRAIGNRFFPTPWRGRFFDYQLNNGIWLPLRGEVAWIIDQQDVVCWEGQIANWRVST